MATKEELEKIVEELTQPRDPRETSKYYAKLSKTYEKDCITLKYNGPLLVVKGLLDLGLPKDIKILDLCTGTGEVASLLHSKGYTNIDGLDGTPEMLEIAKQKPYFKKLIHSYITKDERIPIVDQTYDAVVASGCFCPGHIKWDSLPQIIRIVKSGGVVLWVCSQSYYADKTRDEDYRNGNNDKIVESLCEQRKWEHLPGSPKTVEDYFTGVEGTLYSMKVL